MRRIFISHRNNEPDVLALIETLQHALVEAGFDVLVDFERLAAGAALREDIYTWLGVCHGAIVLLSPSALADDSAWVPTESSILAWRKTLDKSFVLIPVLLPGVTTDDLRRHLRFRDLGLHDLLCVIHASAADTSARVMAGLATVAPGRQTPVDDLAEQIEAALIGVKDDFLDEAMRLTGVDRRRLPRGMSSIRTAAVALLQAPLKNTVNALEYLAPRMPASWDVGRILDIVAPNWVDLNAARWIAYCAAMPSPRPAAVINAETPFGAEMYIRRACSRPPRTMWYMVDVTAVHGESVFEDLAVEIQEALRIKFQRYLADDRHAPPLEQQMTALLAQHDQRGHPVVVVVSLATGHAELMPSLQERFPYLTFLFLSGGDLPDEECPVSLLRHVDPVLEAGREHAARLDYQTARSFLHL